MSGGEKTTTQQSVSLPKHVKDGLETTSGMASDWLKSPDALAQYGGTTVIPYSQQSLAGMNQMQGTAQNAMGAMQNPLKAYSGMMDMLNPIAQGDFSQDNTFNNSLRDTLTNTTDRIAMEMEGAGRAGGGLHQATMARALGEVENQAKLDRMNWAGQGLQSYGNNMAGAYQTAMQPAGTMLQLGGMNEDLAGKYAQEALNKWNSARTAPLDAAASANAIFGGNGALTRGTNSTVFTPSNPGQQALGYGTAALGAMSGNPALMGTGATVAGGGK